MEKQKYHFSEHDVVIITLLTVGFQPRICQTVIRHATTRPVRSAAYVYVSC